jgi:polyphosphate glucokinase
VTVLGIDIGGSSIKAGAVDLVAGRLVGDLCELDTPRPAPPGVLATAVRDVVAKVGTAGGDDGPIGCTFPGRLRAGASLTAVNLDESWVGERPADHFEHRVGRPFHVLNDADAAGLAEMRFGAGRDRDGIVLLVTLGTGIGTALFHDGELLPGTELGEVDVDGRPATEVASCSAREQLGLDWRAWAENVGRFLQRMQDLVDPQLIIVGGRISEDPSQLEPALRQPCEVVPAALGNAAGVIGAALFASRSTHSA